VQIKWWALPIIFLAGFALGGVLVWRHDVAAGSAAERRLTTDKRELYARIDSGIAALANSRSLIEQGDSALARQG
jgi:hypothetical protein